MRSLLASVSFCVLLAALPASAGPKPVEAAAKRMPMACPGLTTAALGLANVTIVSANEAAVQNGLPAACIVEGAANERTGVDGRSLMPSISKCVCRCNGTAASCIRSMAAMTARLSRPLAILRASTPMAASPRWRAATRRPRRSARPFRWTSFALA